MIYLLIFVTLLSCGDPFDTNISRSDKEEFYSVGRGVIKNIYINKVDISKAIASDLEVDTFFSIDKNILRDILLYISDIVDEPTNFHLNNNVLTIYIDEKDGTVDKKSIKVIFNESTSTFDSIEDKRMRSSEYFAQKYNNNDNISKMLNSYILKKRYVIHKIDESLRLDCFVDIISKNENGRASLRVYSISIGAFSKYTKKSKKSAKISNGELNYQNNELHELFYQKDYENIKLQLYQQKDVDKIFELNSEGHSLLSLAISMNNNYSKNSNDLLEELLNIDLVKEILYKIDNVKKYVWKKERINGKIVSLESYPILALFYFTHSKTFNKNFKLMNEYKSVKKSKNVDEYFTYLKSKIENKNDKLISFKKLDQIYEHIKKNKEFEKFALDILKYLEFIFENIDNEDMKRELPYFKSDKPIANICIDISNIITKLSKNMTEKAINEIKSNKISEKVDKLFLIDKIYERLLNKKNEKGEL